MTRERALELADEAIRAMFARLSPVPTSCVADAIMSAVAEEREACAKIAEKYACLSVRSCAEIADEIRERGK